MNTFPKAVSAIAAGVALALVGSGAAFAVDSYYGEGLDYGPNATNGGSGMYYSDFSLGDSAPTPEWAETRPQASASNSNWDGAGYFAVDGDGSAAPYLNDDGETGFRGCLQTVNGADTAIVCADEVLNGLTVHPEVYLYGDVNLRRLVWVVSNDTQSSVATSVEVDNYSECDEDGFVFASNGESGTDDEGLDTNAWNWMVQREADTNLGECGIEASAWQSAGAPVRATTNDTTGEFDDQYLTFPLNLAAGQQVAFAFFYGDAWIDDTNVAGDITDPANPYVMSRAAGAQSQADFFSAELSSWNETSSRGIDPALNVVNWAADAVVPVDAPTGGPMASTDGGGVESTGLAAAAPQLAATGADSIEVIALTGLAVLLTFAGVGAVVAKRRRSALQD